MPVLKKDLEEILYAKKMASLERKPDFDSDIENLHKMMAKAQESIDSAKNTIENGQNFLNIITIQLKVDVKVCYQ